MTSLSLAKLKSYLPLGGLDNERNLRKKSAKNINHDNLVPEIGFQLTLDPGNNNHYRHISSTTAINENDTKETTHRVPELIVRVNSARHLPASFGIKSVEGYVVKVKLFPGSLRFDSSVQTCSWPTFNESFKFPLESTTKSSFKVKQKKIDYNQSIPEHLFRGHFVVLTVFALLELPPGAIPSIREKLKNISRRSFRNSINNNNNDKTSGNSSSSGASATSLPAENGTPKKDIISLTTTEMRRNIGSVTYFLDPKLFEENPKTRTYNTRELWLPIKDITVTAISSTTSTSVNSSPKGQIELTMQLCHINDNESESSNTSTTRQSDMQAKNSDNDTKNRWSISEMKKILSGSTKKEKYKGLCLKVITSKMRCSIRVKEEFENAGGQIYVKTIVFEHGILSNSWKSEQFSPSLSTRWNADNTTMIIPLNDENCLDNISIKSSVAIKTQVGKKIFLGTLHLEPSSEHLENMLANKPNPVTMWHNFK